MSKWSSIALLPRPVTKIICSIPASRASSTAYWISGRSTTGSISLGIALVAGRKRVPRPATGKTALRIGFMGTVLLAARSKSMGKIVDTTKPLDPASRRYSGPPILARRLLWRDDDHDAAIVLPPLGGRIARNRSEEHT